MFHIKTGVHFDHRIGCCNFSVIGRNCKLYEREEYVKYDNINKERERIAREFEEKFPDIEAVIGGEILDLISFQEEEQGTDHGRP